MPRIFIPAKRRYLVRFDPKRIPHAFADVLVIGGGIAGIRAALAVEPSQGVIVVTKDRLLQSNSAYAQGGIAGVFDPLDNFGSHAADTIAAGKGLCDPQIVDMVVREGPHRIRELISYGAHFDMHEGEIALTLEGGHSHRRIVHALGDATGQEVMRAMAELVRSRPNVLIWESTFTIDLLTHAGSCRGALVWNPNHGKTFVWAKQTILATGGAGRLYRETTNPEIATADGHAIAFCAGAELRDMEMVQFHPTVLYIAGSARHLISEAARGEGAVLRDVTGYRFMGDYDPALELAPRDVVSRAIATQMAKTRHPCVYLDFSHLPTSVVDERFPHIRKVCAEFGLNFAHDLIPVRPGRALHDRRPDDRRRRPHDAARAVGGGRSQLERPARRQSPGLEQPGRGARLRAARTARAPRNWPPNSLTRSPPSHSNRTGPSVRRTTDSTSRTYATR